MIREFSFIQASQVPSNVCMFGDLAWLTLVFFKDNQTTLVIKTTHERGITQLSSSNGLKSTITKPTPRQGPSENQQDCGKQLRWPANGPAWLAAGKLWQWHSQSYICLTDSWPSWSKQCFLNRCMDRRCNLHISSSLCHQKKKIGCRFVLVNAMHSWKHPKTTIL